jgi:glycerate 2-kinase
MEPMQFMTDSLRQSPRGEDICRILAAAINSVDASKAINNHASLNGQRLVIDQKAYDLAQYGHVYIAAIGKASIPMATSCSEILGSYLTAGLVITKKGFIGEKRPSQKNLSIVQANHPIPDSSNLRAAEKLTSFFAKLSKEDLVICLLSGGGSALLMKPSPAITLDDVRVTTQLLLSCGAEIGEVNVIRKHIDEFKGGKLADFFYPAGVVTLILSDVMGDAIDQIASGPTTADPTTFSDAWSILKKYQLIDSIPPSILAHLREGMEGRKPETVKMGDPMIEHVQNVIVGNNAQAVEAAGEAARQSGFVTQLLGTPLQGEASVAGRMLAEKARSLFTSPTIASQSACFIAGGETTVHIHGTGKGGRNLELAMGSVKYISGENQIILTSLATDGDDGPTDAAGAVVTNQTYQRGLAKGLDPEEYLAKNDAYHYFEHLGDLIKTGPTLTNVNDLVFIFTF